MYVLIIFILKKNVIISLVSSMKKCFLIVSVCLLLFSIINFSKAIYIYYQNNNTSYYPNKIKKIDYQTDKIKNKIDNKKEELDILKNNNIEKVELLDLWEKELRKIKENS